MTSRRFAATVPITVLLAYLGAQGLSAPLVLLILSAAVFAFVVIAAGQVVMRVPGASDLPLAAVWTFGVAVTGPALYGLQVLLPVTSAAAFAVWAVIVIGLDIALRRRAKPEPVPDRVDLAGLLLCCIFTAIWCRSVAAAPVVLAERGFLPAWVDYFIHAGVISQLGDARAIDRGSIFLAGIAEPAYHYASYTLPAVLATLLDQPGLPLATSVWVPIGFLALTGGAYALGSSLAGSAGGIAALIALFVIPDSSNYGLRNGYFSFHWNLLAHPGSTFALGAALLSVSLLQRWTVSRSRMELALSAALVAATFSFRVHVFVLLLPAWLLAVGAASHTVQRRRVLSLLVTGAMAIAVVVALRGQPTLPEGDSWSFGEGRALERFLHQVHRNQEPTAYQGLYSQLQTEYGDTVALVAGAMLVYPVALGIFLFLLPIAMWMERSTLRLRGIDAFPVALVVSFGGLMAFAPTPFHHDATDLIQRPSVLLYAATAIWTLALLVRWLSRHGMHGAGRMWQTMAIAAALTLPVMWISAADLAAPKFAWARRFAAYGHLVERELLQAAAFIRGRSHPGDTLATSGLSSGYVAVDPPTVLVALSATPSYLARPWVHLFQGRARADVARTRFNALTAIEQTPDRDTALQQLREIKVRWYVATAFGAPSWDPGHRLSAFARGNIAVYDALP